MVNVQKLDQYKCVNKQSGLLRAKVIDGLFVCKRMLSTVIIVPRDRLVYRFILDTTVDTTFLTCLKKTLRYLY